MWIAPCKVICERDGAETTLWLSQRLIQIDLVSIQAKHFAIDSFIFLHKIIPRGRKTSNVLGKTLTLIKACFVILDWGRPEASSDFNHVFNAGLPGEGAWDWEGCECFSFKTELTGIPSLGKSSAPAGWVVTGQGRGSCWLEKVLRWLSALSRVNPYHKEWVFKLGRILRKAPEMRKRSRTL